MSEEPRERPARVKVEEAAMKKLVLLTWARMVNTEETHRRLNPMMAIRRQYLITNVVFSDSNTDNHRIITGSNAEHESRLFL